jgi:hypothetical protein
MAKCLIWTFYSAQAQPSITPPTSGDRSDRMTELERLFKEQEHMLCATCKQSGDCDKESDMLFMVSNVPPGCIDWK